MSDNAELIDIAGMVSEHPAEALERLGAINRDSLAERDAYYHDFLTLKANDKAYIDHTTDSIILRLLPYYEGEPLYPEVLYYAGRVYSDLGDYPTSLRYFQEALDHIPSDNSQLEIKGNILSQTAQLLNALRMFDSAIPYLKEAIEIDNILEDTINIAYDNQLLGAIYIHINNLDSAEWYINMAYNSAKQLSEEYIADMQLYQSLVQYNKDNLDTALILIRGIADKVEPFWRNAALINSADIYLANGIRDTAYMYANELIHGSDINNLKNGYRTLLSPGLIDMVPRDSLVEYVTRYSKELNRYYNLNNSQQSIVQESMYNYQLHDRERAKAERKNTLYLILIVVSVFLTITMALYFIYRRKVLVLRLRETIHDLNLLQNSLGKDISISFPNTQDIKILRRRIKEQILSITDGVPDDLTIPQSIIQSEVYRIIKEYIESDKPIPVNSAVWSSLEQEVLKVSPLFKDRIKLLAGEDIKVSEYYMLLLIKCGFTHGNMQVLFSRTKGAITYRRQQLNKLIFGGEVPLVQFNRVIRSI